MEKSYIKSTLDRNSYRNLVYNVTREGRMLEDLTAKEFDEWKAQVAAAEEERRSMKALYQEKSGDYSY
jgi:hypothetical protein